MKGIATETAVTLLIALVVLAVCVALLMMSPALRQKIEQAIGFMGSQLGAENTYVGHALHIKLYPDSPQEIWEFHLTDDPKHQSDSVPDSRYFTLDSFYNRCVIFTTRVENPDKPDWGYIYYINSGAIIQDGCGTSLNGCIKDFIDSSGCVAYRQSGCGPVQNYQDPKFGYCTDCTLSCEAECDSTLQSVEYVSFGAKMIDKCSADSSYSGGCPLLIQGEYTVKNGLICGNDEQWHSCYEGNKDSSITVQGINYKCTDDEFGHYVWTQQQGLCQPGALKPGTECEICSTGGAYVPSDAKCLESKGPGYNCNSTGYCIGPKQLQFSDLVYDIGRETHCPTPNDWTTYFLANGTFTADFNIIQQNCVDACKKTFDIESKAVVLSVGGGLGLVQLAGIETSSPICPGTKNIESMYFTYLSSTGYVSCGGDCFDPDLACLTPLYTQSKGQNIIITNWCKDERSLKITGYRDLGDNLFLIKTGIIQIKKDNNYIYLNKVCNSEEKYPGTECRVCNNATVPFIDDDTICLSNYGKSYCVHGNCSDEQCLQYDIQSGTTCKVCNSNGEWIDDSTYCPGTQVCVNGQCVVGKCLSATTRSTPAYCATAPQCSNEHFCQPVFTYGGKFVGCVTICKANTQAGCQPWVDLGGCEWTG